MLIKCPPSDTFDISRAAALYSTLAGVLAGFAFFALIFILTALHDRLDRWPAPGEEVSSEQNHLTVTMVCAFMGLIVTTILYAVLSAEQNSSLTKGRAATEELISGVVLAFSVMALLYGLTLLISGVGLKATAHEARAIVALSGPALSTMFLGFAGQDYAYTEILATAHKVEGEGYICKQSQFYDTVTFWGAEVLPVAVFGVTLAMVVLSRTVFSVSRGRTLRRGQRWFTRNFFPKVLLVISLLAAARSASLSERNPAAHISHVTVMVILVGAALTLCLQAMFIIWGAPGESLIRRNVAGQASEQSEEQAV